MLRDWLSARSFRKSFACKGRGYHSPTTAFWYSVARPALICLVELEVLGNGLNGFGARDALAFHSVIFSFAFTQVHGSCWRGNSLDRRMPAKTNQTEQIGSSESPKAWHRVCDARTCNARRQWSEAGVQASCDIQIHG